MRILTKGIHEIKWRGKEIVLTYAREEDAWKAMDEIYKDNQDWINKKFPNGVFDDGPNR